MPSSLFVCKQRSPASDEGCRIDIAMHLAAPFSTLLFSLGGGRLVMHVDSVQGDLVWSHRRTLRTSCTTQQLRLQVESSLYRKPGNSRGLEIDGNLVKNQVTVSLRSWFIASHNNKVACIHCHLVTPAECQKCALIRG